MLGKLVGVLRMHPAASILELRKTKMEVPDAEYIILEVGGMCQ